MGSPRQAAAIYRKTDLRPGPSGRSAPAPGGLPTSVGNCDPVSQAWLGSHRHRLLGGLGAIAGRSGLKACSPACGLSLAGGRAHVVPEAGAVNVSALHNACVSAGSARPLVWRRVSPQTLPARAAQALKPLRGWASAIGFYNQRSAAPAAGR